jgi:dipeptide transport system substrate-binding protein
MLKTPLSAARLLFLTSLILLSSCFERGADKREFIFCSEGSPLSFNPQLAGDGTTFDASSQTLYNRLVDFEPGSTNLIPSLAKSWSFINNGKTVKFKLRKNINFHTTNFFKPTRKLNADDVVFTFSRMLDETHPYHNVGGGGYEYFKSIGLGAMLKSVEKTADHEVIFNLVKPNASFLANLAMDFASVLSAEYADKLSTLKRKADIDSQPIGTGPFKFLDYVEDKKIHYLAHKDYFLGRSAIDELTFLITPDSNERVSKLKSKKCHLIKEPPPKLLPELSTTPSLKLVKIKGLNTGYIGFNLNNPKLKNKKLRQAIGMAMNRRSYIESVYLGRAEIANSPLPPAIWNIGKKLRPIEYNLSRAKDLIEESGVDIPITLTMWTLPVSRPYNPNGQKMGEMMRNDLRQIGVDLRLSTSNWPAFLENSREGKHELIEYGWSSDNGDPDNFLYTLLSCDGAEGKSNVSRFCNKEYDRLVTKARFVFTREERKALYEKALLIFREELPWIPIAHANVYRAMTNEVLGYVPRPLGTESFYGLSLKSWGERKKAGSN